MIDKKILDLFNEKLDIAHLEKSECENFLISITNYLRHSRNGELGGRSYEYLASNINKLLDVFSAFGFSKKEITILISNMPSLLNIADDCYNKLLILGVVEKEENNIRKSMLLSRTIDFRMSIKKIYARYKLIAYSGHENYTWNNLIHISDNSFCNIFVAGIRKRNYQIFNSVEEVKTWLDSVDINELDINEFKEMDVNKEFVSRYEEHSRKY